MALSIKSTYVLAVSGCLNTNPDSVESIIAGANAGATGSVFNVDLTGDGIPVLCSDKKLPIPEGGFINISEASYSELKEKVKKIVVIGQAIDLAKSFGHAIAFHMVDHRAAAMIKLALKHADYSENAYILETDRARGEELARRYEEVNVMLMVESLPEDMSAFALSLMEKGIFGICTAAENITQEACAKARMMGIFMAAYHPKGQYNRLSEWGVNFIYSDDPSKISAVASAVIEV